MSRYHFKPHIVRFVQARYGKCLLCGKEAKGSTVIWVKDVGVVCQSHDAYALIYEYDDGYRTDQTVVKIFANKEEAESGCRELNEGVAKARAAVGFRPASYTVRPLKELVYLHERVTELEE
jgi:hypothetical protein